MPLCSLPICVTTLRILSGGCATHLTQFRTGVLIPV
jgi:hypothetical protein